MKTHPDHFINEEHTARSVQDPITMKYFNVERGGLTKREYFSILLMQANLTRTGLSQPNRAVQDADELIEALNKEKE